MTQAIKITGADEAIKTLNSFKKAQLQFATATALNQLVFELKKDETEEMQRTFNKLARFTEKAPRYTKATKESLSADFFLLDNSDRGQSPSRYLAPQVYGGEVYVTRFNRRLQRMGVIQEPAYVLYWTATEYRATPGLLQRILFDLKSEKSTGFGPVRSGQQYGGALRRGGPGRFFIKGIPGEGKTLEYKKRGTTKKEPGFEGPGIYTYKGKTLQKVFSILKKPPTVPAKYDWTEFRFTRVANEKFPTILFSILDKLV